MPVITWDLAFARTHDTAALAAPYAANAERVSSLSRAFHEAPLHTYAARFVRGAAPSAPGCPVDLQVGGLRQLAPVVSAIDHEDNGNVPARLAQSHEVIILRQSGTRQSELITLLKHGFASPPISHGLLHR